VRRATAVKEVLLQGKRVTGVRIKAEDNDYEQYRTIEADNVICTIPPKYIFNVLPKEPFPAKWVELLQKKFWGAGLLTAYCGAKSSLWESVGIEDGSFIYMPGIIRDEGYIGAVDMVMCDFTAWGDHKAGRSPQGKHDFLFSTALTDEEMRNPKKVNRVIEVCEAWARAKFPSFDRDVEFIIWTPGPEAYGLWRPVGEDRPDVKSPWVKGLHFAGDQYGERLWGGGVDGAALSAVMCVDTMMGSKNEEAIFPAYHRGIPKIAA